MKKDEKLKALFERFDDNIINDIQAQLDEELAKNDEDFDPDKVSELTSILAELKGGLLTDERKRENIEKITDTVMANQKRSHINRIYKFVSAICACLVIVAGLNIYTMNAFGDDLFSAAIKAAQSGFSLDFSSNDTNSETDPTAPDHTVQTTAMSDVQLGADTITTTAISLEELPATHTEMDTLPATETDVCWVTEQTETAATAPEVTSVAIGTEIEWATLTYADTATGTNTEVWYTETASPHENETTTTEISPGDDDGHIIDISGCINSVCSQNNISVCGIDNSFMPIMNDSEYYTEQTEHSTDIYFYLRGQDGFMNIIIEQYDSRKDIPEMLIPSNTMNYDVIEVPCGTAFLFTENNITTAIFINNNTVYTLTGQSSDPEKNIIQTAAMGFIPYTEN